MLRQGHKHILTNDIRNILLTCEGELDLKPQPVLGEYLRKFAKLLLFCIGKHKERSIDT